jgi:hypothetical protein
VLHSSGADPAVCGCFRSLSLIPLLLFTLLLLLLLLLLL